MKAWVVTVDMGLGHQRATYPFVSVAEGGIFTVGGQQYCSAEESRLWSRVRNTYEMISRCKSIPLVGTPLFGLMDRLLSIPPFYPVRDLSAPDFQVKLLDSLIDRGLCRGMLELGLLFTKTPYLVLPVRDCETKHPTDTLPEF